MQRIDATGAVATLPTPVANTGTAPGYFAQVTANNLVPTVVSADFLNAIQEELANVATSQGATLNKSNYTQVLTAIRGLISSTTRVKLSGNLNLYVATNGSDTLNTGQSSGSPFLTLQHAIDAAYYNYDYDGSTCIINIANGTYVGSAATLGPLPGTNQPLYITGNQGAPGNVILSVANGNCITVSIGSYVIMTGVSVQAGGSNTTLVGAGYAVIVAGGYLSMHYCNVLSSGTAQISAVNAGVLTLDFTPVTFGGTSMYGLNADCGSLIWMNNSAITFASGCTYTGAFMTSSQCGTINLGNNVISGTFVGAQWNAGFNGTINLGAKPSPNQAQQQTIPGSVGGYPTVNTIGASGGFVG